MATWARSWWCKAPIPRTGCSTIPIGTGASIPRPAARRAAWQTSARPGGTWPSTSRGCGTPRGGPISRPTTKPTSRARERAVAVKVPLPEDSIETPVDPEDSGAVAFRMGDRARGAFTASQVSAGRKNRLNLEIYGTKAGVAWDQERPDELWIGNRNTNNQIIIKDPSLLKPLARSYADLPGGHSEGYDDTFKQVLRRFYGSIEEPGSEPEYPQFADGLRTLTILQAEMESHQKHAWVDVA